MSWQGCKNILCIRPDNMGDLIMTVPALRALIESFDARITVLTSSMAKGIISSIPEIDDAIIFDLPWIKSNAVPQPDEFNKVIAEIRSGNFDAAIVFTVYSQNPLPTAMLAYLAGIPRILAYCRENPYHLLTDWVPDKEPYTEIKHQVTRDLALVATIGATTINQQFHINVNQHCWPSVSTKLTGIGAEVEGNWLILHPGASEPKRQYANRHWLAAARQLIADGYQVLLTGTSVEKPLTEELAGLIGSGSFSVAGLFNIEEFVCLVQHAPVVVSVNTGTVHIAAAVGTPVVVLYAQTNPQHTPWQVPNKVLYYPVPAHLRSKNEVIAYVNQTVYSEPTTIPLAADIVNAVKELISLPGVAVQPFRGKRSRNRVIAAS